MLLLVRAVHHLAPAHHQETGVAQVGRVQPVAVPVQHHDTRRAAAYQGGETGQLVFF